jgi:hypothetical protein
MNKKIITLGLMFVVTLLIIITINIGSTANANGKGDDNREFNCGGSCHMTKSKTAEITMESSSLTANAGDEIVVYVNITNTEAKPGKPIGVFLVTSYDTTGSQPSASGWTIIEDPNGGKVNYVEMPADDSRGGVFEWKLQTPSGNGNPYYQNFPGVTIEVIAAPGEEPGGDGDGAPADGDEETELDEVKESKLFFEPDTTPLYLGLIIAGIVVAGTQYMRKEKQE